MAATYNFGYRLGLLAAGAGALYIAGFLGLACGLSRHGDSDACRNHRRPAIAAPAGSVVRDETQSFAMNFVAPIVDLARRFGPMLAVILLLVALYRLPDFLSGVMANPLYIGLGFSKSQIATMSKVYGIWIGIAGAFAGGFTITRIGLMPALLVGGDCRGGLASLPRAARSHRQKPAAARAISQRRKLRRKFRRCGAHRLYVVAHIASLCREPICAAEFALRAAWQIFRRPVGFRGSPDRLREILCQHVAHRRACRGAVPVFMGAARESGTRAPPKPKSRLPERDAGVSTFSAVRRIQMKDRRRVGVIIRNIGDDILPSGEAKAAWMAVRLSNVPMNIQKNAPSLPSSALAGPNEVARSPGIFCTSGAWTSRKCFSKCAGSAGFFVKDDELGHAGNLPQNRRWRAVYGALLHVAPPFSEARPIRWNHCLLRRLPMSSNARASQVPWMARHCA